MGINFRVKTAFLHREGQRFCSKRGLKGEREWVVFPSLEWDHTTVKKEYFALKCFFILFTQGKNLIRTRLNFSCSLKECSASSLTASLSYLEFTEKFSNLIALRSLRKKNSLCHSTDIRFIFIISFCQRFFALPTMTIWSVSNIPE